MRTTTCRHNFDKHWPYCDKCGMTVDQAEKEAEDIQADVDNFMAQVKSRRGSK